MTTSEQLEHEAELARNRIAADLDELRGRITPGQMVDQLVDYVREGRGAAFVRNLREQVVANPLPVTLVGAGLAWLAMAGRRPDGDGSHGDFGFARAARTAGENVAEAGRGLRDSAAAAGERATDAAGQWTDRASEVGDGWVTQARSVASSFGDRAGETAADLQDAAGAAASAMDQAASTAYDAAARSSRQGAEALGRAAGTLSETAAAASHNMIDLFKEQPLVLASVGLAIGALFGASLPATEAEDRLVGEASDATKSEAKDFAERQLDKGKAVGREALDAVSRGLDEQFHQEARGEEHTDSPDTTLTEAGHEAPLAPSQESGVMETESHGAARDREHPAD